MWNLLKDMYVLDGRNVRPARDIEEWGRCFESSERIVAHTTGDYFDVSTVFLGIRHARYRKGPPVLFETLISTTERYDTLISSDESFDHWVLQYASWDDAEAGHGAAVRRMTKQVEFALADQIEDRREADLPNR